MQDRFKFRFWDKKTKTMEKTPMVELRYRIALDDIFDDDRVIFMQCTGIKDKHGKLIYEGDIVYKKGSKDWQKNKLYSQIVYDNMYGHFNLSDENGIHNIPMNRENIEVVGNIYENPELIRG